jgi:hypothetical protein
MVQPHCAKEFSLSKQVRTEVELRCNHAEEGNFASPKIDHFGQETDYFLLH